MTPCVLHKARRRRLRQQDSPPPPPSQDPSRHALFLRLLQQGVYRASTSVRSHPTTIFRIGMCVPIPAPAPQGGVGDHLLARGREYPAPAPQGGGGTIFWRPVANCQPLLLKGG